MGILFFIATYSVIVPTSVSGSDIALKFNPTESVEKTLIMPDGKSIKYHAYERIYYVTNVEDSTYQYLNFYVPESVFSGNWDVPIFLRTYVGGYMASEAMEPSGTDATGRALAEGYAVCIPGARGRNSVVIKNGERIFTGRAPAAIVDLKAAVRYLRYNDVLMPGNAEKIITDGTSAGGALSALLGATGNSPLFDFYLKEMGAAEVRDDVFASVCYCPITDLEHSDMAYEWLYGCTDTMVRNLSSKQIAVSEELAGLFPDYLNSLELKTKEGVPLTDANYLDYVKSFIIQSAQKARNEGCVIPLGIGIVFNEQRPPAFTESALNKIHEETDFRREAPSFGPQGVKVNREQGEFVIDVDMVAYLNYVANTQALKTPPAFDALDVLVDLPTPENEEFGNDKGSAANFTQYSLAKATGNKHAELNVDLKSRIYLMNPMNFINDGISCIAKN